VHNDHDDHNTKQVHNKDAILQDTKVDTHSRRKDNRLHNNEVCNYNQLKYRILVHHTNDHKGHNKQILWDSMACNDDIHLQ